MNEDVVRVVREGFDFGTRTIENAKMPEDPPTDDGSPVGGWMWPCLWCVLKGRGHVRAGRCIPASSHLVCVNSHRHEEFVSICLSLQDTSIGFQTGSRVDSTLVCAIRLVCACRLSNVHSVAKCIPYLPTLVLSELQCCHDSRSIRNASQHQTMDDDDIVRTQCLSAKHPYNQTLCRF
jgi:hypothetical protein